MLASRLMLLGANGPSFRTFKALVDSPGNLVTFPYAMDNAAWVKQRAAVSANAVSAPDGSLTADKVTDAGAGDGLNTHGIFSNITAKAASPIRYRAGVMAKAGEIRYVDFGPQNNNGAELAFHTFDLESGVILAAGGVGMTDTTGRVVRLKDGWRWIETTATSGTATTIRVIIRLRMTAGDSSYTGDGSSGMYAWGAYLGLA